MPAPAGPVAERAEHRRDEGVEPDAGRRSRAQQDVAVALAEPARRRSATGPIAPDTTAKLKIVFAKS